MNIKRIIGVAYLLLASLGVATIAVPATAADKPNIVIIMGDDIGMWNIGAYHRGMMAGTTPHIDKLAAEGAIFTDYYAEASCTAGRANFITGELPIRTGMTTVGQAGARQVCQTRLLLLQPHLRAWVMLRDSLEKKPPRRPQRIPAHRAWLR